MVVYWYVGSVVGKSYLGEFKNITVDANEGSFVKGVTPASESEDDAGNIGGVVGWTGEQNALHKYSNIAVTNVDVTGVLYVGGIFGHLHTNCSLVNSSVKHAAVSGKEQVAVYAGRVGGEYGTIGEGNTAEDVTIGIVDTVGGNN